MTAQRRTSFHADIPGPCLSAFRVAFSHCVKHRSKPRARLLYKADDEIGGLQQPRRLSINVASKVKDIRTLKIFFCHLKCMDMLLKCLDEHSAGKMDDAIHL